MGEKKYIDIGVEVNHMVSKDDHQKENIDSSKREETLKIKFT